VRGLILTGGTVVESLSPPRLAQADVAIAGDRIIAVGGTVPPADNHIGCTGCLIIPGLVCAHHHLYSALARGMPYSLEPPRDFLQILQRIWWRLDRALDPGAIWISAWAGGAEALLAGTTTIVDHHASPNAIEESLDQVGGPLAHLGARAVLCYEVTDRDGPEGAEAGIKENRRFVEQREAIERGSLLRGMIGAHASFTLSGQTLGACVETARSLDAGIHIHVAESDADQRDALARTGKRVVHRLADAGLLDDHALLAHCIHLDDDELDVVASSGATAVHNPTSNMNNGVGHASVRRFERLALGTDGIGGDMVVEAKTAYWRAREADLSVSPQWALDRLAESGRFAGSVFGEPLLGKIEPGAPADLAVIRYDPPTPLTAENLAGHFVFGLSAGMVRDVFVAGDQVVRDGKLTRADHTEVASRSRQAGERLWQRMETIGPHPFHPAEAG
jgi:putative selenium metabolism protein SsnA